VRLGDWVPALGDQWMWDIAEIMERETGDMASIRDGMECVDGCTTHYCYGECASLEAVWDALLEARMEDPHYPLVVESIREHGFTVPVTAQVRDDGTVVLGDGHHRLAACLELGITEMPVVMAKQYSFISEDSFLWGYADQHDADYQIPLDEVPPPPTEIVTRDGRVVEFDPIR